MRRTLRTAAVTRVYLGLTTGAISVNLGIGRQTRRRRALTADLAAPREVVVFDVIAATYADRRPTAMHIAANWVPTAEAVRR